MQKSKAINKPQNRTEQHIVIQDNSLFELTVSKRYLGQLDIKKSMSKSSTIERYDMFEDQHTAIFAEPSTSRLMTVTNIEGVSFQTGASVNVEETRTEDRSSRGMPSGRGFTPVLSSQNSRDGESFPLMNFEVRPPNGRSMYAIIDWINNRFSSLWILISLVDTAGKTRLFRAPIPNSHNEGNICTGSLKFKGFSVENVNTVIQDAISGGFNADLAIDYGQYGYFDQKNSSSPICRLVWSKPMHTISAELQNSRSNPLLETMQSCVTLMELSDSKKRPLPISKRAIEEDAQSAQRVTQATQITAPVQEDAILIPEDAPTEGVTA
jgi:hypothetical protein